MVMSLQAFMVVLAAVFLFLAAVKVPEPAWLTWGWAGMFIWMVSIFFGGFHL